MNLNETLDLIAATFNLDADELKEYASVDNVGGWDKGHGPWPMGSIWSVEGQVLYALIRATGAADVLEMGAYHGCSSTHIVNALEHTNGEMVTVDVDAGIETRIVEHERRKLVVSDLKNYLPTKSKFGLIFEDSDHDPVNVEHAWRYGVESLAPGGFMISHDAMHWSVGEQVRKAIESTGVFPLYVLSEPSDCGLAIWRKPFEVDGVPLEPDNDEQTRPLYVDVAKREPDYDEMSYADLYELAKKRNLVTTKVKRNVLIRLLQGE